MTPVLDILAGMLAGTLMGLGASAHAAVMFTYRPPRLLQARIESGNGTNAVMFIMLGLVLFWIMVAIAAAFVADALMPDVAELTLVPSSEYLTAVVVAFIILGGPTLFILRERWLHGIVNLAIAFGICGFLIPNLVIALQGR